MKKTKFSRFFETLIYTILLALPLISVFARVIYTQSNKNAYLSYSDVSNYRSIDVTSATANQFAVGRTYQLNGFKTDVAGQYGINDVQWYVMYSEISLDWSTVFPSLTFVPDGFGISNKNFNPIQDFRLWLHDPLTDTWSYLIEFSLDWKNDWYSTVSFEFTMLSYYRPMYERANISYFVNVFGKLDNAFDYGLQKTIDDFGQGNINFTSWFGTLFSNNTNLLYLNFVNMYLNYALWVSVAYLLYYFLNWFIRFVRETLDNLIYKETKN